MESLTKRHQFTTLCKIDGPHTHSIPNGDEYLVVQFPSTVSCNQYNRKLYCLTEEAKKIDQYPASHVSSRVNDTRSWLAHCHDFRNRYGEVLVPHGLRVRWNAGERVLHYRETVWSIDLCLGTPTERPSNCLSVPAVIVSSTWVDQVVPSRSNSWRISLAIRSGCCVSCTCVVAFLFSGRIVMRSADKVRVVMWFTGPNLAVVFLVDKVQVICISSFVLK